MEKAMELLKRLLEEDLKNGLFSFSNMVDDGDGHYDDMSTKSDELVAILEEAKELINHN